ncbi:MAG: hypothetical protein FIB06_11590 [Betaproteobacteria bacterium]|nr:hypothetical protein [Betaproteobacteria bacterium]
MIKPEEEAGVLQATLDRFNNLRLPRALALKDKVDRGDKLDETEVKFLADVAADLHTLKGFLERHPEYEQLVVKGIGLYTEITEKAIANEQAG